jgi:hypothetical protein
MGASSASAEDQDRQMVNVLSFGMYPPMQLTKVARKYVTVHFSGEGIYEHNAQYL